HLRDTEEQRKYNDEHYEFWGFNQDGTFEYGKYIIFVTKEEHLNIHTHSEESKAKMSASQKKRFRDNPVTDEQGVVQSKRAKEWLSDNDNYIRWLDSLPRGENHPMYGKTGELATRYGICGEKHPFYGKHHTEEAKQKIGDAERGEKNHNYGKNLSEETKKKISENNGRYWKGKHLPEETRRKLSEAHKGSTLSEEAKKKIGEASKGRTHSDSAKQAIGMSSKERWSDEEYR
ncbi:MAG TPA: NUMOD3 domain-containing DNA-binding protein, partial [Fibrobacteraceae bacterium]|nr:NUMOD3 domain-containing DNA-binding protein [Fibrobacteraceae bacterium]